MSREKKEGVRDRREKGERRREERGERITAEKRRIWPNRRKRSRAERAEAPEMWRIEKYQFTEGRDQRKQRTVKQHKPGKHSEVRQDVQRLLKIS